MAWKARLKSIPVTSEVTDSFFAEIEFHDDVTGRSFQQSYKIMASGETLNQIKQGILAKCTALDTLDTRKATLIGLVGTDIE